MSMWEEVPHCASLRSYKPKQGDAYKMANIQTLSTLNARESVGQQSRPFFDCKEGKS